MQLTRRALIGMGGTLVGTSFAGCTAFEDCTHFGVLKLTASSSGDSDATTLSDDELSGKQQSILAEAIEERFGTCVDGEKATEFKQLIRTIFRVDEEIKHASPKEKLVRYRNEQYLASFYVAVE